MIRKGRACGGRGETRETMSAGFSHTRFRWGCYRIWIDSTNRLVSGTPDLTASAKATASPPERSARRRKVGPTGVSRIFATSLVQLQPRRLRRSDRRPRLPRRSWLTCPDPAPDPG